MEFLDFLKYGAIGISLALAILSYRLLSKEQEKTEVRPPILNTIKIYFLFAVLLSVFFGSVEIYTSKTGNPQGRAISAIDDIWARYFTEFPDSTLEQKISRISKNGLGTISDTAVICKEMLVSLKKCQDDLNKFDKGFYQNVIKLQNTLNSDPDGWICISYQTEKKTELIAALKGVFNCLGENCDELSDKEIVEKWKAYKGNWSNDKLDYVFKSDITQVVKTFLNTYYI